MKIIIDKNGPAKKAIIFAVWAFVFYMIGGISKDFFDKKHGLPQTRLTIPPDLFDDLKIQFESAIAEVEKFSMARKVCLASWYGTYFHGRKTANGETFNQFAPSAAHRWLPLGTRVLVENELNGRSIVLRINDRGPFIEPRMIDLSFEAARQLDMVEIGVCPVRLTVLDLPSTRPGED